MDDEWDEGVHERAARAESDPRQLHLTEYRPDHHHHLATANQQARDSWAHYATGRAHDSWRDPIPATDGGHTDP
jgi:hypothetical protein